MLTPTRKVRSTRSPTIAQALREAERGIKTAEASLQELRERRERLGAPFVFRRLSVLRDELKRKDFDVAAANRALKTAVDRIVVNPESALLELHWRDSEVATDVPFPSRHITAQAVKVSISDTVP